MVLWILLCLVSSPFAYGAFTLSGRLSQNLSARIVESIMRSEPQNARTLVWALPRSLAATYGITVVFFSSGYLDVSVHRVPSVSLWIHDTVTEVYSAGFPHSDIHGSLLICSSPWLFAAYHVFLRLLVPRHPPCALFCLIAAIICLQMIALCTPREAPFMCAHPVFRMHSASFHCSSCHSVGNFH